MNRRKKASRPLRLLQINVNKSGPSHDIALAFANQEKIDFLLIQEPYIFRDRKPRITKRHPAYECFSPSDDWSLRPRVLTYLRKGVGLQAEQARPLPTGSEANRDLLFLNVFSPTKANTLIINIYNSPVGSTGEGSAVRALTLLTPSIFPPFVFLAGDFNLHHSRWEPSFRRSTALAEPFLTWADQLSICLVLEPDSITHKDGHVLDLAFASGPLVLAGVESSVAPQLCVSSDHLPLLSLILWDQRFQEPQAKL
jgi:endonuclease/exonuclease/phosphatase (EEP) superfamily protein YafD